MDRLFAFFAVAALPWLFSCEKEFIPDSSGLPPRLVVEGYIEAGGRPTPPYVTLTRSLPFFSELSAEELENSFVHDAVVRVSDGERVATLTEICLDELTSDQKALAGNLFGLNADSLGFNFCVYIDLTFSMMGQEGKTYTLEVEADGQYLEAVTTIPFHAPLDSMRFQEPPGNPVDTLAQLLCHLSDPAGQANFYRFQVSINEGGFVPPISSVLDDRLFDGASTSFPLYRPEARGTESFDLETFGLYRVGDRITVKWISLDKAHYDFWNTLEYSASNQGPFSNYTLVESNIQGGLGIWGGLSATYYELLVQK